MKFENTEVFNFEGAIRGMRNPMNSWDKSDSRYRTLEESEEEDEKILSGDYYEIGENDIKLAQTLIKAGSEHRKFMRQIFVSVDITAPLFFFKEFDTYKVGTVANSTSTMHKLASTPITMECFEMDDFEHFEFDMPSDTKDAPAVYDSTVQWRIEIELLEALRKKYLETKEKKFWKALIRRLPESWLQTRTVTMNYENVRNMYNQRCVHLHKLTEWSITFKEWVETLPYAKELLCITLEKK